MILFLMGLLFNQNPGSGKPGLSVSGNQDQGNQEDPLTILPASQNVNSDRSSAEYQEMIMNTSDGETITTPIPSLTGIVSGTTPIPQFTPPGTMTSAPTVIYTTTIPVPVITVVSVTPVPTSVSPSAEMYLHGQLIIPHSLTVSRGTTVIWKNQDFVPRSVTSGTGSPGLFNSGMIQPGESFAFTFIEPGTYPFISGSPKVFYGSITVI
jgi:hypothetical protein